MPSAAIGAMVERLTIQRNNASFSVSSLTRASTTATATTSVAHGFVTGDYVTIAGATPSGYTGRFRVTVTGATTFTFTVSSGLSTPATGTMTATYASDAQGGRKNSWTTLDTVWAEMRGLRGGERLEVGGVAAQVDYRFRIYSRVDVTEKMRVLWTPTWPPSAPQQTLEIHGVLPFDDGRTFMTIECGVVR